MPSFTCIVNWIHSGYKGSDMKITETYERNVCMCVIEILKDKTQPKWRLTYLITYHKFCLNISSGFAEEIYGQIYKISL
jgi:hypothetical protein